MRQRVNRSATSCWFHLLRLHRVRRYISHDAIMQSGLLPVFQDSTKAIMCLPVSPHQLWQLDNTFKMQPHVLLWNWNLVTTPPALCCSCAGFPFSIESSTNYAFWCNLPNSNIAQLVKTDTLTSQSQPTSDQGWDLACLLHMSNPDLESLSEWSFSYSDSSLELRLDNLHAVISTRTFQVHLKTHFFYKAFFPYSSSSFILCLCHRTDTWTLAHFIKLHTHVCMYVSMRFRLRSSQFTLPKSVDVDECRCRLHRQGRPRKHRFPCGSRARESAISGMAFATLRVRRLSMSSLSGWPTSKT